MVFCYASMLRGEGSFVLRLIDVIITIHLRTEYGEMLGDFSLKLSVFVFSVFCICETSD